MSGLRGLVEKATPGPWEFDGFEHVVSLEVADIVCGLWQGLRAEGVPTPDMEADAALIALAPDLALWAADAAIELDAVKDDLPPHVWEFHKMHSEPDGEAEDCIVCRIAALLARFAAIQDRAENE